MWVNIPGEGYVGVGEVKGPVVTSDKFMVTKDNGTVSPIINLSVKATNISHGVGDPNKVLYMVPVKWLKAVPRDKAIRETGFFGNQNTVCKPLAKKWQYTVERLKKQFGVG